MAGLWWRSQAAIPRARPMIASAAIGAIVMLYPLTCANFTLDRRCNGTCVKRRVAIRPGSCLVSAVREMHRPPLDRPMEGTDDRTLSARHDRLWRDAAPSAMAGRGAASAAVRHQLRGRRRERDH